MNTPLFFSDGGALRAWLEMNAACKTQLLVGYYKVATGLPSLSWSDSVDEALCFGWIDGRRNRISESAYSIRFTPRKPSSIWSAINIEKFERLQAEGRTTSIGNQAFVLRSAQRSRIYYHEQTIPAELSQSEIEQFTSDHAAWSYFDSTPPGYKKRMSHWIVSAKKADTRASRLLKLVQASRSGMRLP